MARTIGGYDYKFMTEVPEDLVCSLCHYPFKNPLQIEACGHKFCKECYEQTKDHAETNSLELCCPLDRQKIDTMRVFVDKSDERKVLSLKVKCQNFGDDCSWTGELRAALDHEKKCCNSELTVNKLFTTKLQQVLNRLNELEIKVKCHEEKDVEKDQQIENLKTQVENQRKQIENLNKQFENQAKQTKEINNKIENQNKELKYVARNIDKKSSEVQNITTKIEELQQAIKMNSMIIPNISNDLNIYPASTAFQWKFNVSEVRSSDKPLRSAPFYNNMNAMCFQLAVMFQENNFIIGLVRYRGKYDDATKAITTTIPFTFMIHVCGKNGKQKKAKFSRKRF